MPSPFEQNQFLDVVDRDEAERRFRKHLDLSAFEPETVALEDAWNRILSDSVIAGIDIPGFDRSNVDGFAVQAEATFGAAEDTPLSLAIGPLGAMPIATGGMVPRGASAVVMVEHTRLFRNTILITRPVAPGANVTFAGSDIAQGELVLSKGTRLTSREVGVLAALGLARVTVTRKPRVAIISTGDELRAPGDALPLGCVYDSNSMVLAAAVQELGCEAVPFGIVPDDRIALRAAVAKAITCDAVLLSGGTSKGPGDLSYQVVAEFGPPGVVVHGVALKPGKPLCLAVAIQEHRRPIPLAVLPGFPTSALFTFHEFLAPVLAAWAGRTAGPQETTTAVLPRRLNGERGRTEYVLVGLVPQTKGPPIAIPLGKGSGSVSAFAAADGFITIPRTQEFLSAGDTVTVTPLGAGKLLADLVVVGSHCIMLDWLLAELREQGFTSKQLTVGSTAGLEAVSRGESDLAGVHLLDAKTGVYNTPFLSAGVALLPGYGRTQGIVYRVGDTRFEGQTVEVAVASALQDDSCFLANRNRGSGTRVLVDLLLKGAQPPGYLAEGKTHAGVVAAVAQGRADWGLAIEPAARGAGLGFLPVCEERYDFLVHESRRQRPAVQAFQALLQSEKAKAALCRFGFRSAHE